MNPWGQPTIFRNPVVGDYDPLQDTQFLLDSNDVLTLFPEESASELHGVFALIGDKQRTIGNSVPFLQIATSAASDVMLKGDLVVRRPNDEYVVFTIDARLSDIIVGAAPKLDVLPVPPLASPEPIILPTPVVDPPVELPFVTIPPSPPISNEPPAIDPPASTFPEFDPGFSPPDPRTDPPFPTPESDQWLWNWRPAQFDPADFQIIDIVGTLNPSQQRYFTDYVDLPYMDFVPAFAEDGVNDFRHVQAVTTANFIALKHGVSATGHLVSHAGFTGLQSNSHAAPEPTSIALLLFGTGVSAFVKGRRRP